MAIYASPQAADNRPSVSGSRQGDTITVPFSFTVGTALALNDVIKLAKLPAQHVLVDCFFNLPDLDTGGSPLITLDAGLWENDATPTVVDVDCMVDGSTAGRTGGLVVPNSGAFLTIDPSDSDRIFGLLVAAAPATGAVGVTITGWLQYRPANSYDD